MNNIPCCGDPDCNACPTERTELGKSEDSALDAFASALKANGVNAEVVWQMQSSSFIAIDQPGKFIILSPYGVDEWATEDDQLNGEAPVQSIRWKQL